MRFNDKRCHCWVCSLICQAAVTASPNPHCALNVSTVNHLTFVVSHVIYFKVRTLASHREQSLRYLFCYWSNQLILFWFCVKTRGNKNVATVWKFEMCAMQLHWGIAVEIHRRKAAVVQRLFWANQEQYKTGSGL